MDDEGHVFKVSKEKFGKVTGKIVMDVKIDLKVVMDLSTAPHAAKNG